MWYCLPDSLSLLVYNPETSSWVTLALLGTVFQTATTYFINPETASRVTLASLDTVFQTKLPTTDNQQPNTNNLSLYFFIY